MKKIALFLFLVMVIETTAVGQNMRLRIVSEFITSDGFVEVCPEGEVGKVVLFSSWDKKNDNPIPIKDDLGKIWQEGMCLKRVFHYSNKEKRFIGKSLEYIPKYSVPKLLNYDWGHAYDLSLSYQDNEIKKYLSENAKIKWRMEIPFMQNVYLLIWEEATATSLNVWLIKIESTENPKKVAIIDKLPPFDSYSFQGLMYLDVLGSGNPCLVLYSICSGASGIFPTASIITIEKGKQLKNGTTYPQYTWDKKQ